MRKYDWSEIQRLHDDGLGWNALRDRLGVAHSALAKAAKRGDFTSRSHREAALRRYVPPPEAALGLKKCSACAIVLPFSKFRRLIKSPDGHSGRCSDCAKAYCRSHYRNNRDDYLARVMADKEARRQEVRRAKDRPCADCGGRFHFSAMDFDHLPGQTKLLSIGSGLATGNRKLRAEMAKCEVVCANCHRVRTWTRLQK